LEAALIENMQRQDLNPIEVAEGYRCLLEEFGHTPETIARLFGKSRSHVVNTKRLLNLPRAIKEFVENGDLTAGHARALLNADQPEELAKHVVAKGLSVRRTEQLAQPIQPGKPIGSKSKSANPTKIVSEPGLTALLGLRVTISSRSGGCVLNIHCDDPENLNDLIERLRDLLLGKSESKRAENRGGEQVDNSTPAQGDIKITREEVKKLAAQYGYSYP
jgi:ParB family chromosome partitioning protein